MRESPKRPATEAKKKAPRMRGEAPFDRAGVRGAGADIETTCCWQAYSQASKKRGRHDHADRASLSRTSVRSMAPRVIYLTCTL